MNCPYCTFPFKAFLSNASEIPDMAPLVCEGCGEVSLLIDRKPYRMTAEQLAAVKQSPAWREVIAPAQQIIRQNLDSTTAVPAVDRTQRTLTDGSPVTPDHREINPRTGQQRGYVVLSAEERAKGFVNPVRRTYTHTPCGCDTSMGLALAETYARDPEFYSGTFCVFCKQHFPLHEFVWQGTTERLGAMTP